MSQNAEDSTLSKREKVDIFRNLLNTYILLDFFCNMRSQQSDEIFVRADVKPAPGGASWTRRIVISVKPAA